MLNKDKQLDSQILKNAHYMITKMNKDITNCGYYRKKEVNISNNCGRIFYDPPKHFEINNLMNQLISFFNNSNNNSFDECIKNAAIIHYFLVNIHPFENGNGRIAALLEHLYLFKFQNSNKLIKINKPLLLFSDSYKYEESKYCMLENKIHNDIKNKDLWNEWFLLHLSFINNHLDRINNFINPMYAKYNMLINSDNINSSNKKRAC